MADVTSLPPASQEAAQALDAPLQQQALPPASGVEAIETEHVGVQPAEHNEPNVLGLDATFLVALAMTVLIVVVLWRRVPRLIAESLDNRIATIREQLDEAKSLREEAEALRGSYDAKLASISIEAEAMRESARHEAERIVAQAQADTDALIDRRRRMAEDRIAAAERQAVAEVRARAAETSTAAAARLLADRMDGEADQQLQDRAIAGLSRVN